MLLTVSSLGESDHFDCCIVGTGPAGIVCAISLAASGKRVALLEGGGQTSSEWSQSLYNGEIVGDQYFDLTTSRLRFFGGTSNHWEGWCRALDDIDFKAKGSFTKTNWPISNRDLQPYLGAASKILEVSAIPDDLSIPDSGFKRVHFVRSPPVRFGEKYRQQLESSGRITLLFDANLINFETNGTDITAAKIVDSGGITRRISARRYILATGGIENSRVLLWSNAQTNDQVVKNMRTLGRYWMEHPACELGNAIVADDMIFKIDQTGIASFSPTRMTMRDADILNCVLNLIPKSYQGTKKLIADMACVAPNLAQYMSRQLGMGLICGMKVYGVYEQSPRAENRIELSTERDALGVPRPKLHWKVTERDFLTAQIAARRFGDYLAKSNMGRLYVKPSVFGPQRPRGDITYHHIGGTRMAASSDDGVVDSHCKVFGQSNLYVAGSSVFPSGGYANPTLTIVQLALRLADHVRGAG